MRSWRSPAPSCRRGTADTAAAGRSVRARAKPGSWCCRRASKLQVDPDADGPRLQRNTAHLDDRARGSILNWVLVDIGLLVGHIASIESKVPSIIEQTGVQVHDRVTVQRKGLRIARELSFGVADVTHAAAEPRLPFVPHRHRVIGGDGPGPLGDIRQ